MEPSWIFNHGTSYSELEFNSLFITKALNLAKSFDIRVCVPRAKSLKPTKKHGDQTILPSSGRLLLLDTHLLRWWFHKWEIFKNAVLVSSLMRKAFLTTALFLELEFLEKASRTISDGWWFRLDDIPAFGSNLSNIEGYRYFFKAVFFSSFVNGSWSGARKRTKTRCA